MIFLGVRRHGEVIPNPGQVLTVPSDAQSMGLGLAGPRATAEERKNLTRDTAKHHSCSSTLFPLIGSIQYAWPVVNTSCWSTHGVGGIKASGRDETFRTSAGFMDRRTNRSHHYGLSCGCRNIFSCFVEPSGTDRPLWRGMRRCCPTVQRTLIGSLFTPLPSPA